MQVALQMIRISEIRAAHVCILITGRISQGLDWDVNAIVGAALTLVGVAATNGSRRHWVYRK